MFGVVEALTSIARSFLGKERACSRVRRHGQLCYAGALTLNVLRGVVMDITPTVLCRVVFFSILRIKLEKVEI